VNTRPSERSSNEWIDIAARTGDPADALLAIATAAREQVTYCPLPPGFRAVYDCQDGTLVEEPIVALVTTDEREHRAVVHSSLEGFSTEGSPIWYLAPGDSLADAEALIRDAIKRRAVSEAAAAKWRAERGREQP
jgi:hypothetical protein